MSYDLKIWSSGQIGKSTTLLTEAGYKKNNDYFTRAGNGWLINISPSLTVEPEDIPDTIMQALPGISYLTEINVEPISAPGEIRNETLRLCKALAKEMKGVVEDPQDGTVKLPSGMKKISYANLKVKDTSLVSLFWYFEDLTFFKSKQIDHLINLFERYMPDALPRRYGEFEPPQNKYAETGKEHLIEFLKNCYGMPVWYATKPFTHLFLNVPNIEKEIELCLTEKIVKRPTVKKDPQSFYKQAQSKYRYGWIEIHMIQEVFLQPDWNLAVKRLFTETAKLLNSFYAEVRREKHFFGSSLWRGIPRALGYAIILNEKCTSQWKRFQKSATKISDSLYMVDYFGESDLKNVIKKIGSAPRNIKAPINYDNSAKYLPYQNQSTLNPPFDKSAVEILWSDDYKMYAEVFKHPQGNSYQFRCMRLDFDVYHRTCCWAPFDFGICNIFDTSEKAIEEATKILSASAKR
jgi:hypothetical protein